MKKVISWVRTHKLLSLAIFVVLAIIGAATNGQQPSTTKIGSIKPATSTTSKPVAKTATTAPSPKYTVAEDKGTYVGVVVPTSYDNVATMKLLGQTLKHDYGSRAHVFVYVFDDTTAASYMDDVLQGKDTTAQDSVYDPHFVAEYQKNAPTNFNQFTIQLNGGVNDGNPVIIKY